MQRARSIDEYVDLIKQARFETKDLRDCLEYHFEELGKVPVFVDELEAGIIAVHQSMIEGKYVFATGDLPFMEIIEKNANDIPFLSLLKRINETHQKGLDIEEA